MKKIRTSDIILTLVAVALLITLAAVTPWPTLTEAAYEIHMEMMP